jgi:UrcA family protein
MTKTFAGCCGALLAFGLQLFPAGSAQAQAQEQEEVTVDGPYTIHAETSRPLGRQMSQTAISATRELGYGDLNLSNPSDVDTLRERVKAAARDTCNEIDRRYPRDVYAPDQTKYECIKETTNNTLARLNGATGRTVARADTASPLVR